MKQIISKYRPTVFLIAAILFVVALGGVAFALQQRQDEPEEVAVNETSSKKYDPPTEEEKAQADTHKDELVDRMNEEKKQSESATKKQVAPVITNVGQSGDDIRIMGYVAGIFEDNGTCTATFTRGSLTVTRTSDGFTNVSTTDCAPISAPGSAFPEGGEWQVILSYTSAAAAGSSQPKTVVVP
jgi:hypothetical protein